MVNNIDEDKYRVKKRNKIIFKKASITNTYSKEWR
jgi:hypothetical protein